MLRQFLYRRDSDAASSRETEQLSHQQPKSMISFDLDLDIKNRLYDGDEQDQFDVLTVFLSGLPDGASLNGGIRLNDDTYSLAIRDLHGLMLRLPQAHPGILTLRVEAIARDLLSGESMARTADIEIVCDEVTANSNESFDPLVDQVLMPAGS